jgi:hypothetical protein
MVHVETVDLADFGICLPNEGVGMVLAQPFLSLSRIEPFRCTDADRGKQFDAIRRTLEVARQADHGADKTHFTIFPEYSVPGIEGIGIIHNAIAADDWPTETLVIAGIDALTREEFCALAESENTYLDAVNNGLDRIRPNDWVNCCVTWAKGEDGQVHRWLQPKLVRAWPEQDILARDMFLGQSVYIFEGMFANDSAYRFSTLICFDWIGTIEEQKVWQWVLSKLHQQAIEGGADTLGLSWLFVIQRNPRPHHSTFLNQVAEFFDQTQIGRARRDQACLVFANCAGKSVPGRTEVFGGSSLVFSAQTLYTKADSPPTNSNGGELFRESRLLAPFKDNVFREKGACIHSFFQVNPTSLAAGAEHRRAPIERSYVYPIYDYVDPRVPSDLVPACIKWLNDELDCVPSLGGLHTQIELVDLVNESHGETITKLRAVEADIALNLVVESTVVCNSDDVDGWGRNEVEGLEHLVNTLDIFESGLASPELPNQSECTAITLEGEVMDLLAVRGKSHEECKAHFEKLRPSGRRRALLVSRDHNNSRWNKRFGSILDVDPLVPSREREFTKATGGALHIDFQTLLEEFLSSETQIELQGKINAFAIA